WTGRDLWRSLGLDPCSSRATHRTLSRRQRLRPLPQPLSPQRCPPDPARPALTELAVAVAAPAQPLQVPLQHVGEEVAGRDLHRVPAQRLANLRHRHPQQPPRVGLAHAGSARRGAARPGPGGPREAHAQPAAILAPRLPAARARPRHSSAERIERGAARRIERSAVGRAGGPEPLWWRRRLGLEAERFESPKKPRNRGFLQRCEEKLVSGRLPELWRLPSPGLGFLGSEGPPLLPQLRGPEAAEQGPCL
uniref:Uncharacterized protein n=1 Tax=Strix occidentalis caurina TaxID=311401 RepID=A0A8D0EEI7_STROC